MESIAEYCATVVAPLFNLFGWTYGTRPNFDELSSMVEKLIRSCDDEGSLSSGRFKVMRWREKDGSKMVSVSLELFEGELPQT